jgi:hypothetical protein
MCTPHPQRQMRRLSKGMSLRRQQHVGVPLIWPPLRLLSGYRDLETGVHAGQHPSVRSAAGWPKKRSSRRRLQLAALRTVGNHRRHHDDPIQRMRFLACGDAARYANAGSNSTVGARLIMLTMVRLIYARHASTNTLLHLANAWKFLPAHAHRFVVGRA